MNKIIITAILILFNWLLSFGGQETMVYPQEDTYVCAAGDVNSHIIRGLDDPNWLKSYYGAGEVFRHDIFMKFDLSMLNNNPDLIENVKLKLFGKNTYNSEHTIDVYQLSNPAWSEDGLSFVSKKEIDSGQIIAQNKSFMGAERWYEWDLTDAVKKLKQDGKNILVLKVLDDAIVKNENGRSDIVSFHSKENPSGNKPHLVVVQEKIDDLLLRELLIDGKKPANFDKTQSIYNIPLKWGTQKLPSIIARTEDKGAKIEIVKDAKDKFLRKILIKKDSRSFTYNIKFEIIEPNNNTEINNIRIGGRDLEFFTPKKREYVYYLPHTYMQKKGLPIEVEINNPNQKVQIIETSDINRQGSESYSVVQVSSGDGTKTEEYRIKFEKLPCLDLFLFIGQSNMAGRGYMEESSGDLDSIKGVYLLTPALNWEIATNPLNKYSSIRKGIEMQKIGPAYGFAQAMAAQKDLPMGLIVNAKGGTSISEWQKQNKNSLYDETIRRVKDAQKWGVVKAVFWHQGEGDSGNQAVKKYPDMLKKMVSDLRQDIGNDSLLFVAGEIAYWNKGGKGSINFNQMINTIHTFLDHTNCISAQRLTPLIDETDPHFDRKSCIELGKRYAEKYFEHSKTE